MRCLGCLSCSHSLVADVLMCRLPDRYKETILVMSERERDMDDALARERARRHLAEEECG